MLTMLCTESAFHASCMVQEDNRRYLTLRFSEGDYCFCEFLEVYWGLKD